MGTTSNRVPVVNRGYTGGLTATLLVEPSPLADPANRTLNVTCWLDLNDGSIANVRAVASAAKAETITDSNWHVVAAGSIVTWTQAVTIPNAAP